MYGFNSFLVFLTDLGSRAVAHNLGSESKKAAGIPMFNAIGQCGSILGSHIFPKTQGPRYLCVSSTLTEGVTHMYLRFVAKVSQVRLKIASSFCL